MDKLCSSKTNLRGGGGRYLIKGSAVSHLLCEVKAMRESENLSCVFRVKRLPHTRPHRTLQPGGQGARGHLF